MQYNIGDKFQKIVELTGSLIDNYCTAVGEKNPIHLDEQFAKAMLFETRVVPGMLLGSLIASVIGNDFPGTGTIYLSQSIKFFHPAYVNDVLKINVELKEIKRNGWLVLKTECLNQSDKTILTGEATVKAPNNINL